MESQLDRIRQLAGKKRWAIVGLSRDPKSFSRALSKELLKAGYEVIPVNGNCTEIDGIPVFGSVGEINPLPDVVLVMTAKESYARVVEECSAAGIKTVWLYGVLGLKEIPPEVLAVAEREGMDLITGYCPLMFLPGTGKFHRFHGLIWKFIGLYPK